MWSLPLANEPSLRSAIGWTGALGALWIGVALLRPTTTFHLAPLLVAGAAPVLAALDAPLQSRAVVILAAWSGALSLTATAAVVALGAMDGPSLAPFPSPTLEAIALSVGGAATGAAIGIAIRRRPGATQRPTSTSS